MMYKSNDLKPIFKTVIISSFLICTSKHFCVAIFRLLRALSSLHGIQDIISVGAARCLFYGTVRLEMVKRNGAYF